MKYKAKAISESEFCRSAKRQLAIVADARRVGDEQVDEKAKWVAAIAAMDTDPAKCRQASAGADILLFGAPRYNGSDASLKQAQFAARLAEDRARRRLADPIEVGEAHYQLLVAEYRAGKIDHAAYCEKALANL